MGDDTLGFARFLVGTGDGRTLSPMPMRAYSVRPRIAMPPGPAGSPTSLLPDGRPSRRVRRSPERPTIEIRPLCGVAVPVSDTSRLPWFESAIPIGRLRPDVTVVPGYFCADAATTE